jgi:diacylglycerol O-acyltransferase / wax synthase
VVGTRLMVWAARSGAARWWFRRQRMFDVFETNVVGPPLPVYLLGSRILDLVPVTLLAGNITLTFAALSYAGRLTLSVYADADRNPDLPALLEGMRQYWQELAATSVAARER